ncbi:hypothetical protein CRG98_044853 [Punica granatum]|uniref:Uncharacterized protein n=1 Tax=Punica granatum TaxID=22663 RepID=A0A2I0HSR4_PUNGR|nr:hypothetical protein CRG98_044853 [Punica granatum]
MPFAYMLMGFLNYIGPVNNFKSDSVVMDMSKPFLNVTVYGFLKIGVVNTSESLHQFPSPYFAPSISTVSLFAQLSEEFSNAVTRVAAEDAYYYIKRGLRLILITHGIVDGTT